MTQTNDPNYPNDHDPNDPSDLNDTNDLNDWMTESFADGWPYGIFLSLFTTYLEKNTYFHENGYLVLNRA